MLDSLSNLSNQELHSQLSALVKTERESTEQVVKHFAEIERRKLYLEHGYNTLFDYATRGLGYSNAAAMRRISAARVGMQVPEVFQGLQSGELQLSTVEKLAPLLGKHEPKKLVEQFKGKTVKQAEELLSQLNPVSPAVAKEKIRPIFISKPADTSGQQQLLPASEDLEEKSIYFRSEVRTEEKRFLISFSVDEEFMKRLERAKELLFEGRKEDVQLENVLGKALKELVKRRCPKERAARREARQEKTDKLKQASAVETRVVLEEAPVRTIPVAVRDEVLKRDNYCCSYLSPDGIRCSSRRGLQIDHITPFSLGGDHSTENLRTLCRAHNLHAAYQFFPGGFMEACIGRQ